MNDKIKPAIIGGAIVGILSVIPVVSAVNVCCCAWALLGGIVATYMYVKGSTVPASVGDGAMIGAIAGVIGAVLYVVLGIPIGLITSNASAGAMVGIMERIFLVSARIFHSSFVKPSSMKTSICGITLKAICLVNLWRSTCWFT